MNISLDFKNNLQQFGMLLNDNKNDIPASIMIEFNVISDIFEF